MTSKQERELAAQRFAALLLRATSLQSIRDDTAANLSIMKVFDHFWQINGFVKELCQAD